MVFVHRADEVGFGERVRDSFASLAAEAPDTCDGIRKFLAQFVDTYDANPEDEALTKAWVAVSSNADTAESRARGALAEQYLRKAADATDPSLQRAFTCLADQLAQ